MIETNKVSGELRRKNPKVEKSRKVRGSVYLSWSSFAVVFLIFRNKTFQDVRFVGILIYNIY